MSNLKHDSELPMELRSMRVLIVDDDECVLDVVSAVLRQMGLLDLHVATDGEAAIKFVRSSDTPVRLLICDMGMVGMDGVECMRYLSEERYAGGLIILSGADRRVLAAIHDLVKEYGLNVLDVIRKPADRAALYRAIIKLSIDAQSLPAHKAPRSLQTSLTAEEIVAGLSADCVDVFFQPKVSVDGSNSVGAECLMRWRDPKVGVIPPADIITVAEAHGLMFSLTRAVFRRAMTYLGAWTRAGHDLHVSVNLSMQNLAELNLPEVLSEIASQAGCDRRRVTLEISESQVMQNATAALDVIARLRLKGFGLSIDDFGTGHASMEKLKQLPFTELKIDRLFVAGATTDPVARVILDSSVRLGHDLGMTVVAEGAETSAEWELVAQAGCDVIQGYVIARPMPADAFIAWTKKWHSGERLCGATARSAQEQLATN